MIKYDMEERTFRFALDVRVFTNSLKKTVANIEDAKQVVRSSGSIGANYIEANEGLSKKDFLYRLRVSRKEAKESIYWLRLIQETNAFNKEHEIQKLINEATELKKILSAIINKTER